MVYVESDSHKQETGHATSERSTTKSELISVLCERPKTLALKQAHEGTNDTKAKPSVTDVWDEVRQ